MLHSVQSILGFTIGATDGEIGKVKDVYFDSKTWKVRYLVVETGNWLVGRKVLLSPVAFQSIMWDSKTLPSDLSRERIKHSPDIDTEQPVSRQAETDLHDHYSWPIKDGAGIGFMTTGMVGGVVAPGVPFEERISEEMRNHEDDTISDRGPESENHNSHTPDNSDTLRSFKNFAGYRIQAAGGEDVGEVEDLIIESSSWNIPFLVIETGKWYSGDKIMASTNTISTAQYENSTIRIEQPLDAFRECPAFNHDQPIDQEFEQKLNSYYQLSNHR